MPVGGTIHPSRPLSQPPLRPPFWLPSKAKTGTFNYACLGNFLFCVHSKERLKASHQQIVIKSSSDRQPRSLHRSEQENFGICGHGLPAAGPSLPGGRLRHERGKRTLTS